MARFTTTRTAWGEMTVFYEADDRLRVRCICKGCHEMTELEMEPSANPLLTAKPVHSPNCPLITQKVTIVPAPEPAEHRPSMLAPKTAAVPMYQQPMPLQLAVLVLLVILAFIAGLAL